MLIAVISALLVAGIFLHIGWRMGRASIGITPLPPSKDPGKYEPSPDPYNEEMLDVD